MPVRLVLVDDSGGYREMLALAFGLDPEIEEVGEAGNGKEGIVTVLSAGADAVVLDQHLPDVLGTEVATALHRELPDLVIVIVSSAVLGEFMAAAVDAGAAAVLDKGISPAELAEEIKRRTAA